MRCAACTAPTELQGPLVGRGGALVGGRVELGADEDGARLAGGDAVLQRAEARAVHEVLHPPPRRRRPARK
eukprot:3061956-Rhodomonas_salina.1